MKRIGFQFGVGVITLCLGVGATWFVLIVSQLPAVEIELPSSSKTISPPTLETPRAAPAKLATVIFKRSHKNRHGLIIAQFEVTNVSSEPLGYVGVHSNPNWNRYYYVKRGSDLKEPDRACGTGLAGYTLLPSKSVTFEVVAGDEPSSVQIGFEFFVGENRLKQTIWSDEVYVFE